METGRKKKWSRIIAMMLAMVMIMQNVVSVGAASDYSVFSTNFGDENTGGPQEPEPTGNDTGGQDGTLQGTDAGDTDGATSGTFADDNFEDTSGKEPADDSNAGNYRPALVSSAVQEVVQEKDADGATHTYIRYQVSITNNSERLEFETEEEALAYSNAVQSYINVNLLLPSTVTPVQKADETSGYSILDSASDLSDEDRTEMDANVIAASTGRVVTWSNQTISFDDTVEYVVYALADLDVTDANALTAAITVDGQNVSAFWVNDAQLAENVTPNVPEGNPSNNTDDDTQNGIDIVAPVVTASASQSVAQYTNTDESVDTYIRYQFNVENTSLDAAAENAVVSLELPSTVTYAQFPEAADETAGIVVNGQTLSWTIESLEAQGQREFVCYALVEKGATTEADITATAYVNGEAVELGALDVTGIELLAQNVVKADTGILDDIIEQNKANKVFRNFPLNEKNPLLEGAGDNILTNTSGDLAEYIYDVEFITSEGFGESEDNPIADNAWFSLKLLFRETIETETTESLDFPVWDSETNTGEVKYQMPAGITSFGEDGTSSGTIYRVNHPETEVGTYTIDSGGLVTIHFNEIVDRYRGCQGYFTFKARFNVELTENVEEKSFEFKEGFSKDIWFKKGSGLSAYKTAGSYNYQDGSFEFAINMQADEDITEPIMIKDVMGKNLTFSKESLRILPELAYALETTSDGFELTLNEPIPKGNYTITYKAYIDKSVVLQTEGKINGLTNKAIFSKDGEDLFTINGDAEYSHQWIDKTAASDGNGGVTWTVTVNQAADQDVSGLIVSDKLESNQLHYDQSKGIDYVKKTQTEPGKFETSTGTIRYDDPNLTMASDGRSWSYRLPNDAGFSSYTFTIHTTVEFSTQTSLKLVNTADINGNYTTAQITLSNSNIGIGSDAISKKYVDEVTQGGQRYALWETEIKVPDNATKMEFSDTLYGPHIFENLSLDSNNQFEKIVLMAESVEFKDAKSTSTPNSFHIVFGPTAAGKTITIKYYSKITQNGTLNNVSVLNVDGKTQASSAQHKIQQLVVTKNGQRNDDGTITWTVNLGNGYGNNDIKIKDVFSNNQELVGDIQILDSDNDPWAYSDFEDGVEDEENNYFTLTTRLNKSQFTYRLVYTTKPITQLEGAYDAMSCRNEVTAFDSSDAELGGDFDVVTIPSNVIEKTWMNEDESTDGEYIEAKDYEGIFQIIVNKGQVNLGQINEYKVTDTLASAFLFKGRPVLYYYDAEKPDGKGDVIPTSEYGYNTSEIYDKDKNKIANSFTITINNPGTTAYLIEYAIEVNTLDQSTGVWDKDLNNSVVIEGDGFTYESVIDKDISVRFEDSAGMEMERTYFYVKKVSAANENESLIGAKFGLYAAKADGSAPDFSTARCLQEKTIEAEGTYFGENPDTDAALTKEDVSLITDNNTRKGTFYLVEISPPDGGYKLDTTPIKIEYSDGRVNGSDHTTVLNAYGIKNIPLTKVSVSKIWEDGGDLDKVRPSGITVQLKRDGENYDPSGIGSGVKTLKENTTTNSGIEWGYTWADLDKGYYTSGGEYKEYIYTVDEVDNLASLGYESEKRAPVIDDDGNVTIEIVNKRNPDTVNIKVKKEWDDDNNRDGLRKNLGDVYVQLYCGTEKVDTVGESGKAVSGLQKIDSYVKNWSYTWYDLPKNSASGENRYSIKEGKLNNDGVFVEWDDDELNLLGYTKSIKSSDDSTASVHIFDIKNTHIPETTEITIKKEWEGENGYTGNRPTEITFELWKSVEGKADVKVDEAKITNTATWEYTWENLPVYEDGNVITYSAKEVGKVNDYEPVNGGVAVADGNVITLINNYIPEKTFRKVTKIWDDNSNADGLRPTTITATLQIKSGVNNWVNAGTVIESIDNDTVELNAQNDWEHIWENLPVRLNGVSVEYRVKESGTDAKGNPIGESYTLESTDADRTENGIKGKDITLTNKRTGEETAVTAEKVWSDGNNQGDGNRPTEIDVTLYSQINNEEPKKVERNDNPATLRSGSWSKKWSNLPKNANGEAIKYTVKETLVNGNEIVGYELSSKDSVIDGGMKITLTNTYKPQYTSASVLKIWEDDDNKANKRPENIQVQLKKSIGGATAINVGDPITLNADNKWYHSWGDKLLARENGEEVTYTVEEITKGLPDGYSKNPVISRVEDTENTDTVYAYSITNTFESEKINITAQKIWDDDSNRDGKRWPSVTFKLFADGEAVTDRDDAEVTMDKDNQVGTDVNTWSYTWTGLEKYKAGAVGEEIVYTVEEINIPSEKNEYEEPVYSDDGLTVTNLYKPLETDISVEKIWDDENNQDGKRPDEIVINLMKNGMSYKSVTLTPTKLSHTWEKLPVYENGEKIVYTVEEVYDNTRLELNRYNKPAVKRTEATLENPVLRFEITNTRKTETVDKTVTKFWEDDNNRDVVRPYSVLVQLYKQVGTSSSTPVANGERELTGLSTGEKWTAEWKNLPKYEDGLEVVYTVKEVGYKTSEDAEAIYEAIPGYEAPEYSNGTFNITNKRNFDKVAVKVVKDWDDEDNYDGERPDSIVLQLWQYAEEDEENAVKYGQPVTVTGQDGAYPAWTYQWKDLPKYANIDGVKTTLQYKVTEEALADYPTVTITPVEDTDFEFSFEITNKHELEKVDVEFTKDWYDNLDQDGIRPTSIWLQLYRQIADGEAEAIAEADGGLVEIDSNRATKDLTNIWVYRWEDLPKYQRGGDLYTYTVEEGTKDDEGNFVSFEKQPLDGYIAKDQAVEENEKGDKFITQVNEHETKEISVNLIKSWVEDNPADRPEEVEFTLMQSVYDTESGNMLDPVKVEIKGIQNPITLSGEADRWVYTWSNLPRRANGKDIAYTVVENKEQMNGYVSSMKTAPGLVELENTKVEKTSITVTKKWDDHENAAQVRPVELSVYLYADEQIIGIEKVTEVGQWTVTWDDLPVYKKDAEGNAVKIAYTVEEGYEGRLNGYELTNKESGEDGYTYTFTNSYNPTVEKTVTKIWQDNNNQDGIRLPEIYVQLMADGYPYMVDGQVNEPVLMNSSNAVDGNSDKWTHTWNNLPKYDSETNEEIQYSVREVVYESETGRYRGYEEGELEELGYTQIKSDDPMELINEHTPDTTDVKVTKIWEDGNDIADLRESIGVRLLANGKLIDFQTLSEDNSWHYEWNDLPLIEDGQRILYEVEEVMSASLVKYYGTKTELIESPAQDKSYESILDKLDETDNGEDDKNVWEYEITNTYVPETIQKTVTKNWIDNEDQDGIRPVDPVIEVQLYTVEEDGTKKPYGESVKLDKTNSWSHTWTELPKYRDKANLTDETKEIEYVVEELTEVEGYEGSVIATDGGFEVNNYHRTDKTSYGVVKYWVDNGNTDRPKEVKFQLYANKYNSDTDKWEKEAVEGKLATFTGAGDRWQYIWSDLETMHNGKEIEYSVEEVDVATGYTVTYQRDEFMTYVTNISTTTEFSKTDITGTTELPGATLQVTTEDGKDVLAQWTSTATPRVIKGILEAGKTYILKEIASPAGYAIAEPVKFTTDTDGKIQKVVMKDAKTNISILKVDDNKKPLAGAELAIKDSKGTVIEQWTSTDKAHVIEGKLIVGEKYTLTEVKAPLTYFLAKDIAFTVPSNGIVELTMVDSQEEAVGKITATKKVTAMVDNELVEHKVASDATYYMALFKDAAGKERYTEYGIKEVVVKKDSSVSEAVTWEKLPSGTYYVFETDKNGTAIPLGERQNEKDADGNDYSYTCVVADGTTNMVELAMQEQKVEGKINLENAYYELPSGYRYFGEIHINKRVLRNGSAYDTNTEFYAGIFTKDEAGDLVAADLGDQASVVKLTNNGTVTVEVPLGGENQDGAEPITYYVMETDKYGDPLDTDVFAYEISGEGEVTLTQEVTEGTVTITNEVKDNTMELDVLKVDENDNPLAGAAFILTYREANVTAGKWTSTTAARTLTLIPGTYTLSELQAPTGYIKGSDATITIAEDGTVKVSGDDISYKNGIVRFVNKKSTTTTQSSGTTTKTSTTSGGSSTSGGGATNTVYKAGSVKTGDETPIALYLLILAGAVAIAGSVIFIKKRKSSK